MKISLILIILLLSFNVTAYNSTVEVWTSANLTITYYGNDTNSTVKIAVNNIEKEYDIRINKTDVIYFNVLYTYNCDSNVDCGVFVNKSFYYADMYADEKGKRAQAEQSTKDQNERRKTAEGKIPELEGNVKTLQTSYERYKSEWKICENDLNYCGISLNVTKIDLEDAESAKWSYGGLGAVLGALGLFFYKFYKKPPRDPDKDLKEAPPAEEPS